MLPHAFVPAVARQANAATRVPQLRDARAGAGRPQLPVSATARRVADGSSSIGSALAPFAGVAAALLTAASRRLRRRGGVSVRGLVALAAARKAVKGKKKAGGKKKQAGGKDAVAKALEALQALEPEVVQQPQKKEKKLRKSDRAPEAPAEEPEAKAPEPAEEPQGKEKKQKAKKQPEPVAAAAFSDPYAEEEEPKAEEAAPPKAAPEPVAEKAPAPEPVAEEAPAPEPAAKEEPKAEEPAKDSLLAAFEALSELDLSKEQQAADKEPVAEQKPPSLGKAPPKADLDDMFAAFSAPPKAQASDAAATSSVADDDDDDDDDDAAGVPDIDEDDEDDDDDDDDDKVIIRKRRGDSETSTFSMETGGITGTVGVGLKGVQARLGGRIILQDASWWAKTGDRVALVGANGCGKTTQLRVLTGDLTPEEGKILKSQDDLKMAVLSQGFVDELNPENTLKEELLSAVPRELKVIMDLKNVQQEIEDLGDKDPAKTDELITRLTDLQTQAEELRVYELDKRMKDIMASVGFLEEDLDQIVGVFSGGWKVRIGLSKIFMTAPDVLLLDEPTNHLDLESVEWLEVFLQTQTLPIVLVSHDREFMDRVCGKVVETVEGMTYTYPGNYTDYIRQREQKLERWQKNYALQEKKVKQIEDFVKVNKGKQAMANARNRKMDELAKMKDSDDWLDPPPKYVRRIKFKFPEPPKQRRGGYRGEILADMKNATHGYGDGADAVLFKDASFTVRPGEKIGMVGRNGAGKSTLLRLLMGMEKPSKGGSIMPADPAQTQYFTQHQADLLPPDLTAFQVVKNANEILMDDTELREIMKKFRFKGDRLNVKVRDLSGGEKARLAIVGMMLQPCKLLIFDEPTNHLDIPMKETLEHALREFEGAVVVVSHDRWFLSQTCEKMIAIEKGKVVTYDGDFRYYMDSNQDMKSKIEKHYSSGSQGIQSVPYSRKELEKRKRGGLKKNWRKQKEQERQELINSMYGGGRRRRR